MTTNRWTHTARLARAYEIGAWQFGQVAPAGAVVELYKDPALQEGDLITIKLGHSTGVARIADLRDVAAKA